MSKNATYLSLASRWGRAKTGFTFICPAHASQCWGGQGQLDASPQPRKVPWSGLVPSSSHQPWGVRCAENSEAAPRCLLSVSFRKAPDPPRGETQLSIRLQHREASSRCRLRAGLQAASTAKQTQNWRLSSARPGSSAYASSRDAVPGIPT